MRAVSKMLFFSHCILILLNQTSPPNALILCHLLTVILFAFPGKLSEEDLNIMSSEYPINNQVNANSKLAKT